MVEKLDAEFFRWVVGGLLSFICAIGMLWLSKVQGQLDDILPRLATVESKEASISVRLDRIEAKLDLIRDEWKTRGRDGSR